MDNKNFKTEAFYTGGGIWLSAKYVDETHYYALDSDFECLGYYDHEREDNDIEYPCQALVETWDPDNLPDNIIGIYNELLSALRGEMEKHHVSFLIN